MEYMGEDKEHLILFAKEILKTTHVDYFIFGHRHIMLDMQIAPKSRILILGEWISLFSYAVYDGENIWLEQFEPEEPNRENQRGISIAH